MDGEIKKSSAPGETCRKIRTAPEPFYAGNKLNAVFRSIVQCVEENYSNPDFNVSKLAELLQMNLSYISKCFKVSTGIGLLDYINRMRINEGKRLISEKKRTVSQVAQMVGFENLNSFIRVFKKYESCTPGSIRGHENEE